jgi:hypothetical protein
VPAHLACRIGARARAGERDAWPAVIAVAAQLAAVPRLGADGRVRPRSPLTVVTLPVSRIGLVAAGAIFFANFAAYTYIGPLLHARAGVGASAITLVLLRQGTGRRAVLAAAVAAAGSLALLGRAGASISSPLESSADPVREQGREAPAPSHDATGGAGNTVQRPR